MSKRNIAYIKPDEPSFLKKLKKEAGYKEGPTVDTKREDLGPAEDLSDGDDEQPTVVVLKDGDLTAEEAQREQDRLEREAEEKPADLSERIVFKAPKKKEQSEGENNQKRRRPPAGESNNKKSEKINNKALLSFDDDEEEEDN